MNRNLSFPRAGRIGWTALLTLPGALAWADPVVAAPAGRPSTQVAPAAAKPALVQSSAPLAPAKLVAARPASAKGMEWASSYEDGMARAKKERKLVLLNFYTDWCGWCKRLDSDVFAKDSFVQAADGVLAIKINAEKRPELAVKYQVSSYPRLFFLDSTGMIVERIRGYMNLEEFTQRVTAVKKGDTEYARARDAAMDPTNLIAIYRFARYLSEASQFEPAIPYWQQVHDLALQQIFQQPSATGPMNYHREALVELARGYATVGLTEVSAQHYSEVLRVYPDNPQTAGQALVGLARLEARKKPANVAKANEYLARVMREYPGTPAMGEASRLSQELSGMKAVSAKAPR